MTNLIKKAIKQRVARVRQETIDTILPTLVCEKVDTDMYFFMMPSSNTLGYYNDYFKKIYIRKDLFGASLVDTLYHEDRHHQQYIKDSHCFDDYIKEEDDSLGYMLQHVEKDARRYAFIKTIKLLKAKGGLRRMLAAMVITFIHHPFKGRLSTNKYKY